jgi:hypothetical protein
MIVDTDRPTRDLDADFRRVLDDPELFDRVSEHIECRRAADELTVSLAADVAAVEPLTIRRWISRYGIGRRAACGHYVVSLSALSALLVRRHGILPAGLRRRLFSLEHRPTS